MSQQARASVVVLAVLVSALMLWPSAAPGAFPGANGRIAFVHTPPTGGLDIFSMDPTGANRTPLAAEATSELGPSYSADGELIAFSRSGQPASTSQIWVMRHDGSGQTQLSTNSANYDLHPAFSPDGSRIAFDRGPSGSAQIYVANADGSNPVQLTFPGPQNFESERPSFSPDGTMIVFSRRVENVSSGKEIWVMNADGSGQRSLTSHTATIGSYDPDYSPDGQRIVFVRYTTSGTTNEDIYAMNADGSNPSQVTSGTDQDFSPVFAPNGSQVAFERNDPGYSYANIVLADPNGLNSGITPLASNTGNVYDELPSWQPLNPPACELSGRPKSKSVRHVKVGLTCTNENASAVVGGTVRAPKAPQRSVASKKKRFAIPPVTAQVAAGEPVALTLKIPRKARRALKRAAKAGKRGKARITATLTDDLTQSATDSLKVRFKKKR